MARAYNPRQRLQELRDRFGIVQEQGTVAQENYQSLYPQYRSAYDEAVAFEPQVKAAYDAFQGNKTQQKLDAYNALLSTYEGLQANYRSFEPRLSEYRSTMESSSAELSQINEMVPGLMKELEVERDPFKRGVRRDYQRTILTSGARSPSAVR